MKKNEMNKNETNKTQSHYGEGSLFHLARSQRENSSDDDYKKVSGWFMGPKGENGVLMNQLVEDSILEHATYRKDHYKKGDPEYITPDMKESMEYKDSVIQMKKIQKELQEKLHGSVPFFSNRYQAHMNWDTVMPANIGYMTAMLYNQNNVATEGGPATSQMEKEVGRQLCDMLGFEQDKSWGHITADGSIANLEAMWASRNLKYYPISIREVILQNPKLLYAKNNLTVTVYESNGIKNLKVKKLLTKCTTWQLLNLSMDEVLAMPSWINEKCNLQMGEFDTMISPYLVQNMGMVEFSIRYHIKAPRVIVPATKHYSWPKAGTILGMGQNNITNIAVNDRCRMDTEKLKEELLLCAVNEIPVLMTVAVIGSTEEGVVDDLEEILAIRDLTSIKNPAYRGLNFNIHCDAAWGGYLKTMMIHPEKGLMEASEQTGFVEALPLSAYAQKQYRLLGKADTVTIDPHKAGFAPYPAGSLCYRNALLRFLITFQAAYIHSDDDIAMGIYGVEGSKPGAAPAAVWMAHKTIPLDFTGYGQILGECTYTTKLYYCYWLTLASEQDDFVIEPLIPLPQKIFGADNKKVLAKGKKEIISYIREHIIGRSNEELAGDPDALALLQQVGSDVLINSFVVNFRKNGIWNTDLNQLNSLNQMLYQMFSITSPQQGEKNDVDFIITMSGLESANYSVPLKRISQNLGVTVSDNYTMNFIINTILQPWPTTHNFIQVIMDTFKQGIVKCIGQIKVSEMMKMDRIMISDQVLKIPADATSNPSSWYYLKNSYAGYAKAGPDTANELFYWFFESRNEPKADTPLLIWLNGGPGASSLAGMFLENGPFSMKDNMTVAPNPMSWNESTHMMFWDQPVGTGFSDKDPKKLKYVKTEEEMAREFVYALQNFYDLHPQYRKSPLYLTGESYAGKYIPYIATEITTQNKKAKTASKIKLKGLAIGNGWMQPDIQTYDQIEYAYMLGMVDTNQKKKAIKKYERFQADLREGKMKKAFRDGTSVSDMLVACGGGENIYDVRSWNDASLAPLKSYLASPILKECIHVPQEVIWQFSDATGPVTENLMEDLMASVTKLLPRLVDEKDEKGNPAYQILLYTGNFDMSCGFSGTEYILHSMRWSGHAQWVKLQREVWYRNKEMTKKENVEKETLGCIKQYNNLMQIEIPMSGHQVPMYQPEISRMMIYNWINKKGFATYNPLKAEEDVVYMKKKIAYAKE